MNPIYADTDPLTAAEEALADTLADCAEFRALALALAGGGVDTYEAARARIHINALPQPEGEARSFSEAEWEQQHRPFALIFTRDDGLTLRVDSATGYSDSGRLAVQIERTLPANGDWGDAAWKAIVGRLMRDLATMSGGAADARAHLAITQIELMSLGRNKPAGQAANGEVQGVTLGINWGDGQ